MRIKAENKSSKPVECLELENDSVFMAAYATIRIDESAFDAPTSPEKLLMLAIIERALRDLQEYVEPCFRRNAITWFEDVSISLHDYGFTFGYCVQTLELSKSQLDFINKRLCKARQFETVRCEEAKSVNQEIATYIPPDILDPRITKRTGSIRRVPSSYERHKACA